MGSVWVILVESVWVKKYTKINIEKMKSGKSWNAAAMHMTHEKWTRAWYRQSDLYLARRCRPVQLAQLYYVEREFCCGVLTAFLGFFVAEGLFDSFPLEDFAETCLRLRSFETTSLFLAPSFLSSTFSGWWKLQCWLHPLYRTGMLHARHWILRVSFWVSISFRDPVISPTRSGHVDICPGCRPPFSNLNFFVKNRQFFLRLN